MRLSSSQKQELTLFKKVLSWHYRNRLVSDWNYINQPHYHCYNKTPLCSYIGYGYRYAEHGSSRAWSGTTAAADFLTAVEPCLYLSILLSSVPCSSEKRPLPYPNMTDLSKDLLLGDSVAHNTRCRTRDDIKELLSYPCLLNVCKVTMMKLINWRQLVQVSEQGRILYKMKQIDFGCGCVFFYLVMIISMELHI